MAEEEKIQTGVEKTEDLIERINKSFNFAKPALKRVHKVLNGDTFIISEDFVVKLIGVKAPLVYLDDGKSEYFGRKSLSFTNRLIQGKRIKLKFDKNKIDEDGNILAYVYLPDSKFLNAEIIRQGFGKLDDSFDFIYLSQFAEYEKNAKDKNIGMWKTPETPQPKKKASPPPNKKHLLKSQFNLLKYVGSRENKLLHYWYCAESENISKADFVIFKTKADAVKEGFTPCSTCNPK
jgi:micrococcal nuclease